MDSQTMLFLILATVAILALLISMYMPMGNSEKKERDSDEESDAENDYEKLRLLVLDLTKKLESSIISDKDLKNQINSLQALAGVNREQIKYLTSNANRTLAANS
tara:strand:- start:109 stop:423 length:315 start_codon:yes stop_codon:yes gene_type:complete